MDGQPERLERREHEVAVGGAEAGDDHRVGADVAPPPGAPVDPAAGARIAAGHAVDGQVADERDSPHAPTVPVRLRLVATAAASPSANDTAKLGSVAPIPHVGGSSWFTWSTHQSGPVGESHWYAANLAAHATIGPPRSGTAERTSSAS